MDNEYEKFQARVWKTGASLIITIPNGVVKYGGYKEGDELRVMTKLKVVTKKEE